MPTKFLKMLSLITKHYQSISAVLAFLVWGGWAFYINDALELNERIVTGLAQGTFSLVITLLTLTTVTSIFNKLPDNKLRLFTPAAIVVLITGIIIVNIHIYIGTPEIVSTVTPGLSITFIYSVVTALNLQHGATDD